MAIDPATSASWRIKPLPEQRAPLPYERRLSAAEHARLVQGLVPVQMEDKWFIYLEDGLLRFHRSATGTCIYGVRLAIEPAAEGASSVVTEAWVSRAPGEYTRTDDGYDARLLSFLVERLLLGAREVPFPVPDAIVGGDKASLYRHHVVGHARAADEEP